MVLKVYVTYIWQHISSYYLCEEKIEPKVKKGK